MSKDDQIIRRHEDDRISKFFKEDDYHLRFILLTDDRHITNNPAYVIEPYPNIHLTIDALQSLHTNTPIDGNIMKTVVYHIEQNYKPSIPINVIIQHGEGNPNRRSKAKDKIRILIIFL